MVSKKNLCKDCPTPGVCCHYGDIVNGQYIAIDMVCDFLNVDTGQCAIYQQRHLRHECMTIEEMIKQGTVPKWCRYVVDDVAYQARTDTRLYSFIIVEQPMERLKLFKRNIKDMGDD